MAPCFLALALLVVPALAQDPNALTDAERTAGWKPLFDGKSLHGWRGFKQKDAPAKGWTVDQGVLHCQKQGGGGDLVTVDEYASFELAFDWKVAPGANSGVMFRVSEDLDYPWRTGPEYQILDDDKHADGKNQKTAAASLYALVAPLGKKLAKVGEWNTARILLDGQRLEHWLNGVKVLSITIGSDGWKSMVAASKFKGMPRFGAESKGRICLQDHGDDVWFRGLKLRVIGEAVREATAGQTDAAGTGAASQPSSQPASAPARPTGPPEPLFNGKDLTGWTVFTEDNKNPEGLFHVEDGELVCRGLPIGYIRTTADYTSYVLELDWRWPERGGGNSGVLLRMQDPDKVWPKSIEAQLQQGNAGDFWNIGQFKMTPDPNRTSGRNTRRVEDTEKPIGQWNHYKITVDGGLVRLEINGKLANEATDCEALPGKICLQSEGAEIFFKNIVLRKFIDKQ